MGQVRPMVARVVMMHQKGRPKVDVVVVVAGAGAVVVAGLTAVVVDDNSSYE